MSTQADPWQRAEIAGPKRALLILKPEAAAAMIKKAKRPLLVVGHHAMKDHSTDVGMLDYAIRLSQTGHVPMVATGHLTSELGKRRIRPLGAMSAMDIGSRLVDSTWKGLDGNGAYDLVLFMGLPYYMAFVLLSGLKHFSQDLRTISLDRYYNPHASWSFPNLSIKDWSTRFEALLSKLGGEMGDVNV